MWLSRAGAQLKLPEGVAGVEVSPLVSYGGEDLTNWRGRVVAETHLDV